MHQFFGKIGSPVFLFKEYHQARPICFLRITGLQIFQDEEGCIPAWLKSMANVC